MSEIGSTRPGQISGEDRGADLQVPLAGEVRKRDTGCTDCDTLVDHVDDTANGHANGDDAYAGHHPDGKVAGHRPDNQVAGDRHYRNTQHINLEGEDEAASMRGLERYRREPDQLEPDERLRHRVAIGILVLLGLFLLGSLVGNVLVAMAGRDAGSLSGFSSDALGRLFPLATLVVGFIFGVSKPKKQKKR
jgi:hypothetical protein